MNCCNANGQCDQGKDCPVRKQRLKEINDAYCNGYKDAQLGDPIDDLADTFKALIVFIAVIGAMTLFTFWYWGK
jgi:hypothetical protein